MKICVLSDQKLANKLRDKLKEYFNCNFLPFSDQTFHSINKLEKLIFIKTQKTSVRLKKYLKHLLTNQPQTKVILFIDQSSSQERASFLKMGVAECLSGKICTDELIAKLTHFAEKKANDFGQNSSFFYQNFHFCLKNKIALYQGKEIKLNKKETLLLTCLIEQQNSIVTRNQIYAVVWPEELIPDSNSLEVYICQLRKKLKQACGFNLIKTVCGVGYRFTTQPKSPHLSEGLFY